jgi:hypothetical protein
MVSKSLITDEITKMIGTVGDPFFVLVERGLIKRLTQAVGDDNPLYRDREYAIRSGFGDTIAPPYLLLTAFLGDPREGTHEICNPLLKRFLDGGGKWEFYKDIRPGDMLMVIPKFANAYEKEGKSGKMLFLVTEVTFKNQLGEVIGKRQTTIIQY